MSVAPITLPPDRAGPYLRALASGVTALAPNDDYVPMAEVVAHLQALDPALGGEVLFPAEVEPDSGLPAFTWLGRALAEQVLAREGGAEATAHSAEELERAALLDPSLGERLVARQRLHVHLRQHGLLPSTRVQAALRRTLPHADYSVAYDRQLSRKGWVRLRLELSGTKGWEDTMLRRRPDGSVEVARGLQHLLARHILTPAVALRQWVEDALGVQVSRVSRAVVGPFWAPGLCPPPPGLPVDLERGLVLHLSQEVLSRDIHGDVHRDLFPPAGPPGLPPGYGRFCERRLAVSPNVRARVQDWCAARDVRLVIAPLRPR